MVPSLSYKEGSAKFMVVSFAAPVYVVAITSVISVVLVFLVS